MKRGVFFSIDALLSFTIILIIILLAFPLVKVNKYDAPIAGDILVALSSLKMGEISDSYIQSLIVSGVLDQNKTALEQIGMLTITDESLAKTITSIILEELETKENIGIWYGNKLIYSHNNTAYENASNILTERHIISGIGGLNGTGFLSGYSARAFLSSTYITAYSYFGGYVGEGNLSKRIDYSGNISSAEIELAINNNFTLYINGINSGNYSKSPSDITPIKYSLDGYKDNFISGENTIELQGINLYVAGGHIKITYQTNVSTSQETKKYLPGINGIVNLYDGLSVNGQLTSMDIFLHYRLPYDSFLNIGNTTIWNGSSDVDSTVSISNTQLSSILNYGLLSNSTVPIRLGSQNFSVILNDTGNADVILITAASDSMNYSISQDGVLGIRRNCTDPLLYDPTTARISLAQCLDKEFIDSILNLSGNRMAIINYFGEQLEGGGSRKGLVNRTDILTGNAQLLKDAVDSYTTNFPLQGENYLLPHGGACISCSINSAWKILKENSNTSTRKQFVIVMSDGVPTHKSVAGSDTNYIGIRTGYPANDEGLPVVTSGCESTVGLSVCSTNNCLAARQNANWSSCRVAGRANIESYSSSRDFGTNATVFSIGFGPVAQCDMAQNTLQDVANCGGGAYFVSSNGTELRQIYQNISNNIVQLTYAQQTATTSGNATGILYPDSYINLNYTSTKNPFGLIISLEKQFENTTQGNFSIYPNSTILDAQVTSYSGPRWTDKLKINGNTIYNISSYGSSYTSLGDPYSILIPKNLVLNQNEVVLTTAVAPTNVTTGSASNKIIYTLAKNFSTFSSILAVAQGCQWNIQFEDYTNLTVRIPSTYNGSSQCYFPPNSGFTHDPNDAFQAAVYNILRQLDLNGNQLIDPKITEQSLQIDLSQVYGIPFTWQTEVQIRTWN